MALTDLAIRNAKPREKDYKLNDSQGLCLLIVTSGGKRWRFKYHFGGKEKLLAIGVYPDVTLAEAREARDKARKLRRDGGGDPGAKRKAEKQSGSFEDSFKARLLLSLLKRIPVAGQRAITSMYYRTRMQIEEGFRDTKRIHYGLDIACESRIQSGRRANLLLIAALIIFVLWLVGLSLKGSIIE